MFDDSFDDADSTNDEESDPEVLELKDDEYLAAYMRYHGDQAQLSNTIILDEDDDVDDKDEKDVIVSKRVRK